TNEILATLLNAKLVRINHATQDVEPWLAESWTRAPDGLRYSLKLRPNITFSDGHPFTADDVVFTLEAVYDPRTNCPYADSLLVDHQKLQVAASDPQTVV